MCAALVASGLAADAQLPEVTLTLTPTPTPTPTPNPNANPKACGLLEFAVDSRADSLAAASREGGAAPLLLWAVEPDTKAREQP